MSRSVYGVKPALFDVFSNQEEVSLENEIERIISSRLLSTTLEGICSDFGLPIFYSALPEQKDQIQYAIAYAIMKFEPRLEKATVIVESIKNGFITVGLTLIPHFEKIPLHMKMTLRL